MFRGIVLALVAVTMLSSSALAGGGSGGAKKDATIKVSNDYSVVQQSRIGVILDQTNDQLTAIGNAANPETAFTNAGGKFLTQGEIATFKVKAGNHRITVVDANGDILKDTTKAVARNKTLSVNASTL